MAAEAPGCAAQPPAPPGVGCLPGTVFAPQTLNLYLELEGTQTQNYTVIPE